MFSRNFLRNKITTTIMEINYWTNGKICAKVAFPRYTESVKFSIGLKAEKEIQNENHTEDWALGSHPRLKSFYILYSEKLSRVQKLANILG